MLTHCDFVYAAENTASSCVHHLAVDAELGSSYLIPSTAVTRGADCSSWVSLQCPPAAEIGMVIVSWGGRVPRDA